MKKHDSKSLFLEKMIIVILFIQFGQIESWKDTTPNPKTKLPNYQFLWTHRDSRYIFCDMVVHPGVDNRVLAVNEKKFAIQFAAPEKYDENDEFYTYICDLLWLRRAEVKIVRGKTKCFRRLRFEPFNKEINIDYYKFIFQRVYNEYLSNRRVFQEGQLTPHVTFPLHTTKSKYANFLGRTHRPIGKKFDRIAMLK